jgi:aminoglycoside phosphotransferase family enzyme/predicted kinase
MPSTARPDPAPNAALNVEELLTPEAFAHPVSHPRVRETHISWVVLTGTFAYKIKKAVKFEFIDASTLERRLHYCNEELRLNRRLAPDLYLDVVPIARVDGRIRVGDHSGSIVEHAVRMRQFEMDQELSALLRRADVSPDEIKTLGELLALFHRRAHSAAPDPSQPNTEQMYESVANNLDQLHAHVQQFDQPADLQRLTDWTHDRARSLESSFRYREQCGYIRECHGDLHSGNIVRWQGRLIPFDCIDFDPHLRWIDVLNDIAFLVMDLVSHSRTDLAAAMLSRYLEITGDYDGLQLLPFYAVYRALVRAKVDAITAAQSAQRSAEFHDRLQQRVRTAMHWTRLPQPVLILMHGPSGSGKSWLSEQMIDALPALRIRSDLERKRLAGLSISASATSAPNAGIYIPEMSHRTYARLLECAESCLQTGFHTIVDAAFLEGTDRELFHGLAARLRLPLLIVACQADAATLSARVQARVASGKDPSDADQRVLEAQLRNLAPFEAAEQPAVIAVDTREADVIQRIVGAVRTHA